MKKIVSAMGELMKVKLGGLRCCRAGGLTKREIAYWVCGWYDDRPEDRSKLLYITDHLKNCDQCGAVQEVLSEEFQGRICHELPDVSSA